jgi:hypothetical protein
MNGTTKALLLWLLERLTASVLRIWTAAVLAALLGSLLGPLEAPTAAAAGTLIGLHAVVAVVVLVAARRLRAVSAVAPRGGHR